MRRTRRQGHGALEFGGSGEDSFVAVVVTKLTGALLFILLLAMTIMALIPRGTEMASRQPRESTDDQKLEIATSEHLPDAIAGRPYDLALATNYAQGSVRWGVVSGNLPEGLTLDTKTGRIQGIPAGKPDSAYDFEIRASDERSRANREVRLSVLAAAPAKDASIRAELARRALNWRVWIENGYGFLVLLLVHLVGMNAVGGLERSAASAEDAPGRRWNRFVLYRVVVRTATCAGLIGLVWWVGRQSL